MPEASDSMAATVVQHELDWDTLGHTKSQLLCLPRAVRPLVMFAIYLLSDTTFQKNWIMADPQNRLAALGKHA